MKLFGSITELVAAVFRKNSQQITLRPNQATTYTADRDIQTPAQDADSVLVSRNSTDTLSNKTLDNSTVAAIQDANFTLQDNGDTTKRLQFQLSSITTGTTRTLTTPDADGLILLSAASQSVQNKSLDNTNTVTLKDTLFTLQDDGDTSKQAKFQLSGITTSTTRTFTFPDASTTLVGTDATQTLTGKSISGSTNTITNVSLTAGVTGTLPIGNGGTGQTTANTALNALLPSQTGSNGKVLQTDGSNTSWATVLSSPLTTTGDIIYSSDNSGTAARLGIGASGTVLHGGTTPSYSQIVNADVSASAAIDGSKITAATATAAGTITKQGTGSVATLFAMDGSGGNSSSVTLHYQRIGDWVTVHIPAVSATANTSTNFTQQTAIPDTFARPATATQYGTIMLITNNGANAASPGRIQISTAGVIIIQRDGASTAWTNGTGGLSGPTVFTYYVGTGS